WPALSAKAEGRKAAGIVHYQRSEFETAAGLWTLFEDPPTGDCGWLLSSTGKGDLLGALSSGVAAGPGRTIFPASFANLLKIKNFVQETDPASTIFPTASERLGRSTLGIGARFTTLHWPGVEWAMTHLAIGMTANQNSIPRELVYDV